MSEFIGLAYYTEIPGVFFDIQRTGPSTGMPTRTQQGDLLSIAYLSHGDTKHIALFPANPEECFYLAVEAFDLAERFQTPVFVVSDLDIGMNDWMCTRFTWDDALSSRPRQGARRRRSSRRSEASRATSMSTATASRRARFPACIRKGGYFTRGSGHDKHARVHRRRGRVSGSRRSAGAEARDGGDRRAGAGDASAERDGAPRTIGIISIGGCHAAVLEAVRPAARAAASSVDYMRIRAFPFARERARVHRGARALLSSSSRTATGSSARCWRSRPGIARDRMTSVLDYGGLPLTADRVVERRQSS